MKRTKMTYDPNENGKRDQILAVRSWREVIGRNTIILSNLLGYPGRPDV
jgi:hypothetical protein